MCPDIWWKVYPATGGGFAEDEFHKKIDITIKIKSYMFQKIEDITIKIILNIIRF